MSARVGVSRGRLKDLFVAVRLEFFEMRLSPFEQAAYLWLLRRSGAGQTVWESVANMAEHAGMSTRRMHAALRELEARGMVEAVQRSGQTTEYTLTDTGEWRYLTTEPLQDMQTPSAPDADPPLHDVQTPSAPRADKVDTTKKIPMKEIPEEETRQLVVREESLEHLLLGMVETYNNTCGELPKARLVTTPRRRALRALVKEVGVERAPELLRLATLQVAGDEWWVKKGYGLDNLLVHGRVVEKAEKQVASGGKTGGDAALARRMRNILGALGVGDDA